MNILIIENHPKAEAIVGRCQSDKYQFEVYPGDLEELTVEAVAADIKGNYSAQTDVYIIPVGVSINHSEPYEYKGIRLLKLLRLNHINNHVILLSYLTRDDILERDIRNAIICSEGVSFLNRKDFQGHISESLIEQKANLKQLRMLFSAEYDLDDRHFNSNVFGVWQLMKVQLAYENAVMKNELQTIEAFPKICELMESYNGKLVQFIHGWKEEDVVKDFIKAMHDESCAVLMDAEERLKQIEAQIAFEEDARGLVGEMIEDATNNLGISELTELYNRKRETELYVKELEWQKNELERIRSRYSHIQPLRSVLDNDSDKGKDYNREIKSLGASVSVGFLGRMNLAKREPRIVYVDDMAEEGWADVLQRMVYGGSNEKFVSVPVKNQDVEQIVKSILDANAQKPIDLLILDLRLKDERGYVDPSKLSGIEVLRKLNMQCPSFPILIFTASNKVWSLKEAFKGNATAFWVKGGLEQNDEDETYVKNYLDLIDQINWLTGYKWFFELLAKIQKTYDLINNANREKKFWWETKCISYESNTGQQFFRFFTTKSWILQILDNALKTTQGNLRQMSFLGNRSHAELSLLNSFVMQICDILEQIHHYKEKDDSFLSISKRMKASDKESTLIKMTRNQAAHNGYAKAIEKESVIDFVDFVMNYLVETPQVFANCLDAEEPESINGIALTPIGERWSKLQQGQTITVRVFRVVKLSDGYRYHFRTDVHAYGITASVFVQKMLVKDNTYVKEGDVICVQSSANPQKLYFTVTDCYVFRQ